MGRKERRLQVSHVSLRAGPKSDIPNGAEELKIRQGVGQVMNLFVILVKPITGQPH